MHKAIIPSLDKRTLRWLILSWNGPAYRSSIWDAAFRYRFRKSEKVHFTFGATILFFFLFNYLPNPNVGNFARVEYLDPRHWQPSNTGPSCRSTKIVSCCTQRSTTTYLYGPIETVYYKCIYWLGPKLAPIP